MTTSTEVILLPAGVNGLPARSTCVLTWSQAAEAGPATCGGKGWNLGRLHRYGFPVPAGGVLRADVYEQIIAAASLSPLMNDLAAVQAEDVLKPETEARLAELRAAIEAHPFPPRVEEKVCDFLARNGLADSPIAVRSSATVEDGEQASFAGMHRSFLNVRGVAALLAAVKGCYASLWTPQALAYRRRFG